MNPLLRAWLSEDRPTVARTKKAIKAVLPASVLTALKAPYYRWLHRQAIAMEADCAGVRTLVRPGDFVIDAGAFVGFYAHFLAGLVGAKGQVWSFEPMPETFAVLKRCVTAPVTPYNVALSDQAGASVMHVPEAKGGESLYDAHLGTRAGGRAVEVRTARLDDYLLPQIRRPSFMKIDVEGHELACLAGATQSLQRWRPALMVETLDNYTPWQAVAALLAPLGYRPFRWSGATFVPQYGTSQNTFFLQNDFTPKQWKD